MASTLSNSSKQQSSNSFKTVQQQQQRYNCNCAKFIPQAFNTNKCQQCFNLKEFHSLEALAEFSKSNRKVCKYGYLFIAPPDLELNKTKRWQWRFFIFYDDSELTYSLDENPLTLPQGRINISKCEDIIELSNTNSNDKTIGGLVSYPNSLCLKFPAPLKDIYIAAGNYEEMSKWKDVLMFHCSNRQQINNASTNNSSLSPSKSSPKTNNRIKAEILEDFDDIDDIDDDVEEINDEDLNDDIDEDLRRIEHNTKILLSRNKNHHQSEEFEDEDLDDNQIENLEEDENNEDGDDIDDNNQYEDDQLNHHISNQHHMNQINKFNNNNNSKCAKLKNKLKKQRQVQKDTNDNKSDNDKSNDDNPANKKDTSPTNQNEEQQQQDSSQSNSANNRRLSYKEDDLLRKQRLKENLNQLLIEYKHEEEAHLKKYSRFSQQNANQTSSNQKLSNTSNNNNRTSLDSYYSNTSKLNNLGNIGKSSAFSLVVPPQQLANNNSNNNNNSTIPNNSAFRPVTSLTNLLSNTSKPVNFTKTPTNNSQCSSANTSSTNSNNKSSLSTSSTSSWSSSSSSSSSSSNSPPKSRNQNTNLTTPITTIKIEDQIQQNYKKPCLISPRKIVENNPTPQSSTPAQNAMSSSSSSSTSSSSASCPSSTSAPNNKSLTILVRNNSLDDSSSSSTSNSSSCTSSSASSTTLSTSSQNNRAKSPNKNNLLKDTIDSNRSTPQFNLQRPSFSKNPSNLCGYLLKFRDANNINSSSCSMSNSSSSSSIASQHAKSNDILIDTSNYNQFDRYWFSLNTNLCCLIYWHDKYEQDLGKYPIGKYELAKCCQVIKVEQSTSNIESTDFKIYFHQNSNLFITLRANNTDMRNNWYETVKHTIDNISNFCNKCKPKLVVNPLQQSSLQNSAFSTPQTTPPPIQSLPPLPPAQPPPPPPPPATSAPPPPPPPPLSLPSHIPSNSSTPVSISAPNPTPSHTPLHILESTLSSTNKQQKQPVTNATKSSSYSKLKPFGKSVTDASTSSSDSDNNNNKNDSDAAQRDKLLKENSELNNKFKLLEQIHLDTINEYDKQQNRLYNQIDDMHLKISKYESEFENLNKLIHGPAQNGNISNKNELNSGTICMNVAMQIKSLNEQLNKYKEIISSQEKEIEKLNKKLNEHCSAGDQVTPATLLTYSSAVTSSSLSPSTRSWNKEVKNFDARINDVLGKLKERELAVLSSTSSSSSLLLSSPNEDFKIKCDRLQNQLQEAQNKISQLNAQLKHQQQQQHQSDSQSTTPSNSNRNSLNQNSKGVINLQDFSDDLGKVLMSKEEVITQLEKQLKEKEKYIQTLTEQLNEEIAQSNKYQDALNAEVQRNKELNTEMSNLNENLNSVYSDEIEICREELSKSLAMIKTLEQNLNETCTDRNKFECELKDLQEYSKNEIEILQEEIKTLEYKFVHSQRQAQEYQSILEDMDVANTNSINYLTQIYDSTLSSPSSTSLAESLNAANTAASLQNRLKRNQSLVNLLVQQIVQQKQCLIDQLKERLTNLQAELDECKEENIDLNDHIYSIDVYMREKEAQCDQYQKEKEEIMIKLNCLLNDDVNDSNYPYEAFLNRFKMKLLEKTSCFNDFIKFILLASKYMLNLDKNQEEVSYNNSDNNDNKNDDEIVINENRIFEFVESCNETNIDIQKLSKLIETKFNKTNEIDSNDSQSMENLKQTVKKLIKFFNSPELTQFNGQIVSYMAEQLIHKAALNGHLAFACELLRKKNENSNCNPNNSLNNSQNNSSSLITSSCTSSNSPSSKLHTIMNSSNLNSGNFTFSNEQDEKIFKLASELLLSDDDSLRKLSAQVLNEAQLLTQLNCVLNTLKKIRWKHLKINNKDSLERLSNKLNINGKQVDDDDSETDQDQSGDDDQSNTDNKGHDNNLNCIFEVMKDISTRHKEQISEQLSEVQKLMSISSDDDLLAHLQNENSTMKDEIQKLKSQINTNNYNSKWNNQTYESSAPSLSSTSSSQLRRFNIQPTNRTNQLHNNNSSSNEKQNSINLVSNQTEQLNNHHHHHHHILTDLLSQHDTMC